MKTTFRTIAAVLAAVLALVSCSKANIPGGDGNVQTAKERVFTLTFNTTGTKTALNADGKTPEFQNGDLIKVFDGSYDVELPVSVSNGQATVTVPGSISGDFKAVYPASAWQADAPYFQVKNIQDGTFANANICLAEVTGGATEITFNNQTLLFTFDVTSYEGTYIHVIAARDGISNTVVTGNTKINRIVIPAEDVAAIKSSANKTCYVSVYLPQGKTLTCHDISFANGSKIKVPAKTDSPVLAINNIFPVDMENGWDYDYVELTMTVNEVEDTYKWATMNVGATATTGTESYGTYFAWGDVNGQEANQKTGTSPISNAFTSGFSWSNCPFAATTNPTFNKYVPALETGFLATGFGGDAKTTLDLEDDAAFCNWGGAWRMPTQEEFHALFGLEDSWVTNYNNSGVSGYKFTDANVNSIFLPAAGCADGTDLKFVGEGGCYWSSLLRTSDPRIAFCLTFSDRYDTFSDYWRYEGLSVRALSE